MLLFVTMGPGAGSSGLSWALVANILKAHSCVIAPDMRGHGGTRTTEDNTLVHSHTQSFIHLFIH